MAMPDPWVQTEPNIDEYQKGLDETFDDYWSDMARDQAKELKRLRDYFKRLWGS